MKKLILLTSLLIGFQAHASVTPKEFKADLVTEMNRLAKIINKKRVGSNWQYCTKFTPRQLQLIENIIKESPEISVEDFSNKLAQKLNCFRTEANKDDSIDFSKSFFGFAIHTPTYVKDYELISEALLWLNDGQKPHKDTPVLDSYGNWHLGLSN
ncbi:hypothetical protein DOM22_14135 [Bdellovibrio sp. ZAP7]|uniref:hypothetical protein n=1 Tax=Bdellovibrio sp. ZAP7 TaxID=2231053 RepID=UPI00115C3923|nr:hypothetical protein [Bdellovibrio sp. ZAP7]QDK46221.1 hypothetical protein DOM22_14135 [Bdellovibrio sp. ZAP7]